jgi:hypothetical protein
MTKSKKSKYWTILIFIIFVMIALGYSFNLGESLGKAIAN